MDENRIEHVRRFNREVTRRIGALSDDYLRRGRSLAESRLLFEIGLDGADVRTLRTRLALDSGYLSRLLRALEAQRSEEHTSELQSLMRISYAVFCLKKKTQHKKEHQYNMN